MWVESFTGEAWAFVLVAFRAAGLFVSAPVLSARTIPAQVKLVLVGSVALAAFLGTGAAAADVPVSFGRLLTAALGETVVGLAGGLASRVVFDAALSAGQLAGLGTGLGYAGIINPWSGEQSVAPAELVHALAIGLATAAGLPQDAIRWFARSLVEAPPGSVVDLGAAAHGVVSQAVLSIGLSVRLGYPVLAAGLVAHLAVGIAGRSASQLNLGALTFVVTLVAGGGALFVMTPAMAEAAVRSAAAAFGRG